MATKPTDIIKQLYRLPVTVDGAAAPIYVRATTYCSGNSSADHRAPEHHQYSQRLSSECGSDRLGMTPGDLVRAAIGLGLPEHISKGLQLAERHHVYSHASSVSPGSLPSNHAQRLQYLASHYFGMDCVGFVSAWARLNNIPVRNPETRTPRGFLATGSFSLRAGLSQVVDNDFLIWSNNEHIAMIDHVTGGISSDGLLPILIAEASVTPIMWRNGRLGIAAHPTTIRSRHFGTLSSPFELVGRSHVPVFVGEFRGLP